MPSITVNQADCQTSAVGKALVRCLSDNTPELEFIPSTTISGIRTRVWRPTSRIDSEIYTLECEGSCANQISGDYEEYKLSRVGGKFSYCLSAKNADGQSDLPMWNETRKFEFENVKRKMAKGVYRKSREFASPYTLEDFANIKVDASKKEWNGTADLFAGDEPTQEEIDAVGGLTTIYLVKLGKKALHWEYGYNKMFSFGKEFDTDIRDQKKSEELGCDATFPGRVQHYESYHSIIARNCLDVVAICNVPCGMVDKFKLDQLLYRVTTLVYESATINPNAVLLPSIVQTNWITNRSEEGIGAGGCCWTDVIGSTAFSQLLRIPHAGVNLIPTPNIPPQDGYKKGNILTKSVSQTFDNLNLI